MVTKKKYPARCYVCGKFCKELDLGIGVMGQRRIQCKCENCFNVFVRLEWVY